MWWKESGKLVSVSKPEMKSNPLPLQFGRGAVDKMLPFEEPWALGIPHGFPSYKSHALWGRRNFGAFPGTYLRDSSSDVAFVPTGHLGRFQRAKEALGWAKELFGAWVMVEMNLPEPWGPSQDCETAGCVEISPLPWITALLSWLLESIFFVLLILQQHLGGIYLNPQHARVSVCHNLNLGKEKTTVHLFSLLKERLRGSFYYLHKLMEIHLLIPSLPHRLEAAVCLLLKLVTDNKGSNYFYVAGCPVQRLCKNLITKQYSIFIHVCKFHWSKSWHTHSIAYFIQFILCNCSQLLNSSEWWVLWRAGGTMSVVAFAS